LRGGGSLIRLRWLLGIGGRLRLGLRHWRLLRRGGVVLLCAQLRRGAQAGNQQRTQDGRKAMLQCHKNLG
jgi:hypothetical protein